MSSAVRGEFSGGLIVKHVLAMIGALALTGCASTSINGVEIRREHIVIGIAVSAAAGVVAYEIIHDDADGASSVKTQPAFDIQPANID